MIVKYNKNTGEVTSLVKEQHGEKPTVEDVPTGENINVVNIEGGNVEQPITGTIVDDINSPTKTIRDDTIPQESDMKERKVIKKLAEIRKKHGRIEEEISGGHIPDRSKNKNVDAVMSEWEDKLTKLRGKIK